MNIREAGTTDLQGLLALYTQLHSNAMPTLNADLKKLWQAILEDKNHHIIIGVIDEQIVSSCVIIIIPNLTHEQRPYALIENVITHESHRGKGYATLLLNYARSIAEKENCYKLMLLTSSKRDSTLSFYERAGYNKNDKTAFIQWLD